MEAKVVKTIGISDVLCMSPLLFHFVSFGLLGAVLKPFWRQLGPLRVDFWTQKGPKMSCKSDPKQELKRNPKKRAETQQKNSKEQPKTKIALWNSPGPSWASLVIVLGLAWAL